MEMGKIIDYKDLESVLAKLQGKNIVLTGGCFDLIHYGHYCLLKNARKLGDKLIIALESDEFIKKRKGRTPHHTQDQRAEILSGFEFVDFIIKLPFFGKDQDYYDLVQLIKPKFIAITSGDPQIDNKKKQAQLVQAKVVEVCQLIKNLSTTNIINGSSISGN